MKQTKTLALLCAMSFSVFACTSGGIIKDLDDDPIVTPSTDPNRVEVLFSTPVSEGTKVNNVPDFVLTNGDKVGMFMLYAGGTLTGEIPNGIHEDNLPNLIYSFNTNGSLTASGNDPMYFPEDAAQKVDFISYLPHNLDVTADNVFAIPMNIADQTDRKLYTLYSTETKGISPNATSVSMEYVYALSKLIVNVKAGGEDQTVEGAITDANLIGMTMDIKTVPTTANFNLANQTTSGHTAPGTIAVNMAPIAGEGGPAGETGDAILLPMTGSQHTGMQLTFTLIGGKTYTYDVLSTQVFESGKTYQYDFTFNRETFTVTATVKPWEPTTPINGGQLKPDPAS